MIAAILSLSLLLGGGQQPASTTSEWRVARIVPWYGYGLYGNKTACGQTLTRSLIGVAHRTLPCGTKVKMVWKGRSIIVKVVDRGPWPAKHLRWKMPFDLTAGAAKALGCKCSNPYFTRYDVKYKVLS